MANQKFYESPGKRQEDDFGKQTDWRPAANDQRERLGQASNNANQTLGNIDDVLNDNVPDQPTQNPETPVSQSESSPSSATHSRDLNKQEQQPKTANGSATEADDKENEQLFNKGNLGKQQVKGKGFWNKKRAGIAGGVAGGLLGGGILGLSMLSGPLEFVHIAQLLENSHFSHQEDAGDNRLGHMYRYLKSGGEVGETRMSYLESKYHNKIISKLGAVGIDLDHTGAGGTYKGMTLDPENKNSPVNGMTPEEYEQQTGNKVSVDNEGKWHVNPEGFWGQRRSLKFALNGLGDSRVATVVRMRNLGKYGLVSWHPLDIVNKQVYKGTKAITDHFKKKWTDRISSGTEPVVVDPTKSNTQGVDENGKPITSPLPASDVSAANSAIEKGGFKSMISQIKAGVDGKLAVGALGAPSAALGVVCALKSIDDNVVNIRYAQVVLPLIRVGMNMITVGNQIMSGQTIDPDEVKYLATNFNDIDKNGKVLSTWDQAKSIRANSGEQGGVDALAKNGTRDLLTKPHVEALKWTQNDFLQAGCSTAGQVVVGVISVALTIATLGTTDIIANIATSIGSGIATGLITNEVVNMFSNLLAGDAVALARGATWGEEIDYGARLGANATAFWSGGTALSNKQVAELDAVSQANEQQDFRSQTLASRIFNPYDRKSLISRAVIDNQNPNVSQNVANITSGFMNIGSSLLKLPGTLISPAQAASTTPYDYGFPEYGFSQEDLDNPLVTDPFANATEVAKVLDGPDGSKYIDQAKSCFAVDIVKQPEADAGGSLLWNVLPANQTNPEEFDPYNNTKYNSSECSHPSWLGTDSNNTWLRLRFFILDTGTMEGYACADLGDAQSCQNDGMTDSSATSAYLTKPTSTSAPANSTTSSVSTLGTIAYSQKVSTHWLQAPFKQSWQVSGI